MDTVSFKRRVLSRRERCAKTEHRCDNCDECILPGDRYELTVEVRICRGYKYLWVRMEHIDPSCIFPPDDEETRTLEQSDNVLPFRLTA